MPKKRDSQLLTKKHFESVLHTALGEYSKSIIEAVDFGFEKAREERLEMKKDIKEIRDKLHSLEKRVAYIEEVITKYSKDLKQIKSMLFQLKKQQKPDREKVVELEERVIKLETKYIL